MKRIVKIITAIVVSVTLAAAFIQPASAVLLGKDGFYYSFKDNSCAVLEEYHSSNTVVEIPSEVYSYKVVSIANYVFLRNTSITRVVVPDSVVSIGSSAFYGCANLETIVIPDSVTSFGNSVFANCGSITVYCEPNSYAENYAVQNNIPYKYISPAIPLENQSSLSTSDALVGDEVTVNAAAVGGTGTYMYSYYVRSSQNPEWIELAVSTTNASYKFVPEYADSYDIKVDVVDSNGNTQSMIMPLNVAEPIAELVNNSTASAEKVTVGKSVKITGAATGGVGDYTYEIYYRRGNADWALKSKTSAATLSPYYVDTYQVKVVVTDESGKSAEKILTINAEPKELVNNSTASAEKVTVGKSVKITGAATGGVGDYTYEIYYRRGNADWALKSKTSTATLSPYYVDTYQVKVVVTDESGKSAEKILTINAEPKELVNNSTASAEKVTVGKSVKITGAATGGVGDYTYEIYYRRGNADWTLKSKTSTATLSPYYVDTYQVKVVVTDESGKSAEKILTINAEPKELVNTSTVSAEKVKAGKTVKITGAATGGVGDYTYEIYYRRGNADWTLKSKTNTATLSPYYKDTYQVRVDVKDSNNTVVSKEFTIISE